MREPEHSCPHINKAQKIMRSATATKPFFKIQTPREVRKMQDAFKAAIDELEYVRSINSSLRDYANEPDPVRLEELESDVDDYRCQVSDLERKVCDLEYERDELQEKLNQLEK